MNGLAQMTEEPLYIVQITNSGSAQVYICAKPNLIAATLQQIAADTSGLHEQLKVILAKSAGKVTLSKKVNEGQKKIKMMTMLASDQSLDY